MAWSVSLSEAVFLARRPNEPGDSGDVVRAAAARKAIKLNAGDDAQQPMAEAGLSLPAFSRSVHLFALLTECGTCSADRLAYQLRLLKMLHAASAERVPGRKAMLFWIDVRGRALVRVGTGRGRMDAEH